MKPIYTAFYTANTIYEQEAARLRRSLVRLGLDHDIRAIESRGGWQANSGYTATHIRNVLADYPDRPVVQLDADAVVWKAPALFDQLAADGFDLAVHYRRGHELLNGTIWLAPGPRSRAVMERYESLVREAGNNCHNEQRMLQQAISEMSDTFKLCELPASYCFIFDIMKADISDQEQVVIEHLQCSRETNVPGTEAHANRRKRLAEIGG